MRRDYYSVMFDGTDWIQDGDPPEEPVLVIEYDGPHESLSSWLDDSDGNPLTAEDIDVGMRLQDRDNTAGGVLSVSNRLTGEYIAEINVIPERVMTFLKATRRYGESSAKEPKYGVTMVQDGSTIATFHKRVFLVYNSEGSLLRNESLIPSEIEL